MRYEPKFCMGALRRPRRSVERHSIVREPEGAGKRYGISRKTVDKWKNRTSVAELPTGPREPRLTVLSVEEEEAVIVAFLRYTLPPLDCRLPNIGAVLFGAYRRFESTLWASTKKYNIIRYLTSCFGGPEDVSKLLISLNFSWA